MEKALVGVVAHFYPKAGVAAVNVTGNLKVGDRIVVEGKDGSVLCEQVVDSMETNHVRVQSVKAGDAVGIMVGAPVKEGAKIYRMTP